MLKTVEAILEKNGHLRLLEKVNLARARRVLVTFLEDGSKSDVSLHSSLLSQQALASDWNRPEEDEAWQHLQ